MAKSPSKKSTSKKTTNGQKARKPNALHEKLIKLFTRPNGATITDISEAGWMYSAIAALRIAERRGFKTNVKKVPGELSRYIARKA